MVKRIKVEQGAIARKVGEMGFGVTGQEVKDIVRREDRSSKCSGWKKCLHDPSARCGEYHSPTEHTVTHPSRET